MRSNKTVLLALGAAVLFPGSVTAQSSKEYGVMAKASWAAFECSTLAAFLKNHEEEKRLLQYGYEQGKRFLAAFEAGKVNASDVMSIPGRFLTLPRPTADFVLGKMYESAERNTLGSIQDEDGKMAKSPVYRNDLAENRFRTGNCAMIGKSG